MRAWGGGGSSWLPVSAHPCFFRVLCSLCQLSAPPEGTEFSSFVLILASPRANWLHHHSVFQESTLTGLPLLHARPSVASSSQVPSSRCLRLSLQTWLQQTGPHETRDVWQGRKSLEEAVGRKTTLSWNRHLGASGRLIALQPWGLPC